MDIRITLFLTYVLFALFLFLCIITLTRDKGVPIETWDTSWWFIWIGFCICWLPILIFSPILRRLPSLKFLLRDINGH